MTRQCMMLGDTAARTPRWGRTSSAQNWSIDPKWDTIGDSKVKVIEEKLGVKLKELTSACHRLRLDWPTSSWPIQNHNAWKPNHKAIKKVQVLGDMFEKSQLCNYHTKKEHKTSTLCSHPSQHESRWNHASPWTGPCKSQLSSRIEPRLPPVPDANNIAPGRVAEQRGNLEELAVTRSKGARKDGRG